MSVFDQAFDLGYKAAQDGKPRRSNPSFWKGLIKPSYLDEHAKGYKAGYDAGLREKRYATLRTSRAQRNQKTNNYGYER